MYIGNLCDSGRFQCMGFLETPFIKIIEMFMHYVHFKIKLYLFLFLTDATYTMKQYTMKPNAMQLVQHNTQKSNTCNTIQHTKKQHMQCNTTHVMLPILLMQLFGCIAVRMNM